MMHSTEFKAWRHRMNWTQQQAADALDVSRETIQNYEAGRRRDNKQPVDIPYSIALACDAFAVHAEEDFDFIQRLTTTTAADGLPTAGEAERFRALETEAFRTRVYAGLRRSRNANGKR